MNPILSAGVGRTHLANDECAFDTHGRCEPGEGVVGAGAGLVLPESEMNLAEHTALPFQTLRFA